MKPCMPEPGSICPFCEEVSDNFYQCDACGSWKCCDDGAPAADKWICFACELDREVASCQPAKL